MDKSTNAQYSDNLVQPVSKGYTLNFSDSSKHLKLLAPNLNTVFDIPISEVERAIPSHGILYVTLKGGAKHYFVFEYNDYRDWVKLFRKNGVKTALKVQIAFMWFLIIAAIFVLLVTLLSKA